MVDGYKVKAGFGESIFLFLGKESSFLWNPVKSTKNLKFIMNKTKKYWTKSYK